MPSYNTNFELTVEDIDLIETALLQQKAELTHDTPEAQTARQIHELLGRLHNQKVFYRPRGAYIGG